ncbi:MAG: hypothetical protein ACEQSH_00180 [Bacteroidia bacterium]|jgi:hypothetical protein
MANSAGMAPTFARDLMNGTHAFGVPPIRAGATPDTFKLALYLASASIGPATTAYTATGEATGAGYVAGGKTVTYGTVPSVSGDSGIVTPSASVVWTGLTAGPFDCALQYNSSQSNLATGAFTFPVQTIVAGTFTLTMPTNAPGTALIEIDTTP